MQQTTNYQLNLIETSDAFSPNPLNDNAQKLEAALDAARAEAKAGDAAEADARSKADADEASARSKADTAEANARTSAINALTKRVTALECHKFVTGIAAGEGTVNLGFTPSALFVATSKGYSSFAVREQYANSHVTIVDGGFQHNGQFADCHYIAFL